MKPVLSRPFTCHLPRILAGFSRKQGLSGAIWAKMLALPLVLLGILILADGGGPIFAFGALAVIVTLGLFLTRTLRRMLWRMSAG